MKKYLSPDLEKIYFNSHDVITLSELEKTAGLEEFETRSALDIFLDI